MKKFSFNFKINLVLNFLRSLKTLSFSQDFLQSSKPKKIKEGLQLQNEVFLALIRKQPKFQKKITSLNKEEISLLEFFSLQLLKNKILELKNKENQSQEKKVLQKISSLKKKFVFSFSNFLYFQKEKESKNENLLKNYIFFCYEKNFRQEKKKDFCLKNFQFAEDFFLS